MRKIPVIAAAALAAALVAPPSVASPPGRATTPLFAVGGTQVSNGIFFPGTILCYGTTCYGYEAALQVPEGNDIQFINLDAAAVANTHQIQCAKRKKRNGRPVCQSENVAGPGQTVMITSHLKPGMYEYVCTVHFGMRGVFRIVEQ